MKSLTNVDTSKPYIIAAFDLDGTIIKPLNRRPFPINRDDWEFIHDHVSSTLTDLPSNVIPVIFTNQLGITKGKQKKEDILGKITDLVKLLKWPNYMAYVAIADDENRKPNTGMWRKMLHHLIRHGIPIDKENSFYVGDALGRKGKGFRDHSDSDLKFAENIGIKCLSPEAYFNIN
jgi:bifunctional polynucleotide phosphatase/kinase